MITLKKILTGWISWTGEKLSEVKKGISLYNENSPLQRMLMAKALFLTWISLNYVITCFFAIFFFFWKEMQYTPAFFLVLSGYSLFVVPITLLAGYSYANQQKDYKNSLLPKNEYQPHSQA